MYLIGIAGGSGSGKTTFAKRVVGHVSENQHAKNVTLLHQDSYYLPEPAAHLKINGEPNFDHPDAFDWALLRSHLSILRQGGQVKAPTYDFHISRRTKQTVQLGPCQVVIFDGIFALWDPEIRSLLDLKIFIDVEADIRFIRRLHRDVKERGRSLDGIVKQYYDSVRPMHREFVQPTHRYADLVVGEEGGVASEVVAAGILEIATKSTSKEST